MPVTIFTRDAGPPEGGTGRRFFTDDNRADLTVQSVPNPDNDAPATFLAKKKPPPGIIYKRVTPDFFVVSSIRNDRIWYNRCNRANGANRVMINYPAAEKRQWENRAELPTAIQKPCRTMGRRSAITSLTRRMGSLRWFRNAAHGST